MIVTQIRELTKSRYLITVDDEFTFVLYKGELRVFKIHLHETMEEHHFHEIMSTVLVKRAKLRLLNLLQKQSYTEKQLREKLELGYYPPQVIEAGISYIKSYGYINDEDYARNYIEYHSSSKSRLLMKNQLEKRGIPRSTIDILLAETEDQQEQDKEEEQIRLLLKKKHYDDEMSMQDKKKLYDFLMRRGYSYEKIKRVMNLYQSD